MKLNKFLASLLFIISACVNTSVRYEYADGSANIYLLTETELRYLPVETKESSSDSYQDGEQIIITVSPAQFSELKNLFDQAMENSSIHLDKRVIMSGMISVMGSDNKQCIIKPNSEEMIAIEDALRKIITR